MTQGTQTQLRFLPAAHNDLIFSGFAEEHGFVGVVVALGLYFLLLMQIVQNAQTAPDRAGMYICMGVATLLLFHLLVNVGMVVGEMPVTGIPLPLMSSGGSITFSVFMMLGLVNNVRLRRFVQLGFLEPGLAQVSRRGDVKRISVQQVFGTVFRERRVAAALVHLALPGDGFRSAGQAMYVVRAGVYEGRLHSGALTGHSDPNRLRHVPPLIRRRGPRAPRGIREGGGR